MNIELTEQEAQVLMFAAENMAAVTLEMAFEEFKKDEGSEEAQHLLKNAEVVQQVHGKLIHALALDTAVNAPRIVLPT